MQHVPYYWRLIDLLIAAPSRVNAANAIQLIAAEAEMLGYLWRGFFFDRDPRVVDDPAPTARDRRAARSVSARVVDRPTSAMRARADPITTSEPETGRERGRDGHPTAPGPLGALVANRGDAP